MVQCYYHPEKGAVSTCDHCMEPICENDTREHVLLQLDSELLSYSGTAIPESLCTLCMISQEIDELASPITLLSRVMLMVLALLYSIIFFGLYPPLAALGMLAIVFLGRKEVARRNSLKRLEREKKNYIDSLGTRY